jgi:hypothetical protein
MITDLREQLARAIHENYQGEQQRNLPPDDPAMQPWEQLREDLKESNRQQAGQIAEKLKAIGCNMVPVPGRELVRFEFTPEELEFLSQMEHRRWLDEKLKGGWQYGPVKDPVKKTHPCLVSWGELPEEEKEKDRQAVRAIPRLLAEAGFEIRRS